MHLSDYDTTQRYTAIVKQTSRITAQDSPEEVDELILEIDADNFKFRVGQCVGVLVAGPHEAGHEFHFRLYNIGDGFDSYAVGRDADDPTVKAINSILLHLHDVDSQPKNAKF